MQTFRSASMNSVVATAVHQRTTAPNAGDQFRAALHQGANTVLSGAAQVGLPTTPFLSAAMSSRGASAALGEDDYEDPSLTNTPSSLLAGGTGENQQMQFIALQQRISDENRRYSTLSNVLKARHETAKNAIGNIR